VDLLWHPSEKTIVCREQERITQTEGSAMNMQVLMGQKVLVVNDSPEITSALAEVFAEAGARVTESRRGKDAMQYIAWGGYDVIFIHLGTAATGGSRILEFISQSCPELLRRTVVLTNERMERRSLSRMQCRYSSCLFLPCYVESLVSYAVRALAFSDQRCAV
jgi:DNA-binding NtrC family response regulator